MIIEHVYNDPLELLKQEKFPKPDLNDPTSLGRQSQDALISLEIFTSNPKGLYQDYINKKSSTATKSHIDLERQFLCNNFEPMPLVFKRGSGVYLEDLDGKIYIDCLSAFSAVNQGHVNIPIIKGAYIQMNKLYITSRAVYNNLLGLAAMNVCNLYEYDKVLFMNSGEEASESSIKIARKWGYEEKKIPKDEAKIVFTKGNYWGTSLYACGASDTPLVFNGFGPYDKSSNYIIKYNDIKELENILSMDPNICAVYLEPIQCDQGIIIPCGNYLKEVSELTKKYNVLFIADEIQTCMGRTGSPLYCNSALIKPDILLLGGALSGGIYPVSAVLSSNKIMGLINPGEHGSTFGGNPLAAACVISSIHEYTNKNLCSNAYLRGLEFGLCLHSELYDNILIKEVRGRGLLWAIELHEGVPITAMDISLMLMEKGVLCKPIKNKILR